jgi:hypothetical protein
MPEPEPVELPYGGYEKPPPVSWAAVMALIAGIISGPLSILFTLFVVGILAGSASQTLLALLTLLTCHVTVLLFAISVSYRRARPGVRRGRGLAIGGIIATFAWAILIAAWLSFVLRND